MGLQAAVRAACVALLAEYAADQEPEVKLTVYPARPISIHPPYAFVDSIREDIDYGGTALGLRTAEADIILIHGLFDGKNAADQKDAFVDGFLALVDGSFHAAGGGRAFGGVSTEDIPNYVPDWMPPAPENTMPGANQQRVYYATRITVSGFQGGFA